MRFDLLLAMISDVLSSGLYAPLLLMAFGFLLAVGGAIFLWRRKNKGNAPKDFEESTEAQLGTQEAPAPADPSPIENTRRRSLVAGAERDEGTPAGELDEDAQEAASYEHEVEEAEFEEYEELGEPELEPEWIEDASEVGDTTELEDADLAAAGALAASSVSVGDEPLAEHDTTSASIDPLSNDTIAAQRRPIVFRQFLPQSSGKDGLSFFGGCPIAPSDFQWPRKRGAQGGAPMQFIMQWDCSQLAEQDPTGLLPQDGVLYCFVNFDHVPEEDFLSGHTFIHERGSPQGWTQIDPPDDAGPALGKESARLLAGCTAQIDNADEFVPRVLPRFPFAPVALEYPVTESEEPSFWSNEVVAGALLDIQKSGVAVREEDTYLGDDYRDIGRPFPAFPHDFGTIRVIASRMIEALDEPDETLAEALYPGLSAAEREAQFVQWVEEAKEVFLLGTQRPSGQKLDQDIADDIWQWFDDRKGMIDTKVSALVTEAVDLSLSVNSDGLSSVPSHWIDKAMQLHALAAENVEGEGSDAHARICAAKPARMFGPATFSPGVLDSAFHDHLLLLELPSGAGPQHHFEGKVLQYWITPDDLAAGNFDNVKSIVIEPEN